MSDSNAKRDFAIEVVRRLSEAGYRALWAGGCVRDFLLGRTPQDYDVATDARPEEVRRVFGRRRTIPVGVSFGVILVPGPKGAGSVEVATFRTEGPYLDGRRPSRVAFSSPEQDAQRRDFTINGMFYDPLAQQVLDFVGGEKDLGEGIVRAIGDPHTRMSEDKLRMLRAVRIAADMEFELDEATAAAIREMADEIHVVSAERIAQEFRKMLVMPHRMRAMQLTGEVGLLVEIFPELADAVAGADEPTGGSEWLRTLHMLDRLTDPGFELSAAVLLQAASARRASTSNANAVSSPQRQQAEIVRAICRRLRLSNDETNHICWLLEHRRALVDAPRLPQARLKRLFAQPLIHDLLAFFRVDVLTGNADLSPVVFCEEYLRNAPREELDPPPLITGDDLIEQGLTPGACFKQLLENVRDAQLNGEISTKEEALALVQRLREHGS